VFTRPHCEHEGNINSRVFRKRLSSVMVASSIPTTSTLPLFYSWHSAVEFGCLLKSFMQLEGMSIIYALSRIRGIANFNDALNDDLNCKQRILVKFPSK
jgi:hypothetical protein